MRVGRFSFIRLRDEEHGAVLAIVAISLICLIGMLVLTFDLGRSVAIKRNMVNGADAAALAAARECALAHGETAARQAAAGLLTDNNGAATLLPNPDGFEINPSPAQCSGAPNPNPDDPNTVTVRATVPVEYFFAPIFGFNNGTVVATATATWEAGVANPVPLKLDQLLVHDCLTDENGQPRPEGYAGPGCAFAFDNSAPAAQTGAQRGILDFPEGWPVAPGPNPMACTSQKGGANDLVDYINQMGLPGPAAFSAVMWANPMYVCAAGGKPTAAVHAIVDWLNATAEIEPPVTVYFPVAACDGPTAPCFRWVTTPGHEAYPVVGFVGMRVVGAWNGQEAKQHCVFTKASSDVFCVQLAVASADDSVNGNAVIVRLVD